jgi:DNA anti-recombination protein RmuC
LKGETKDASTGHLEKDYNVAREELKELIKGKTSEIGNLLKEKLENEIERIKHHYENQLKELGGDLNQSLDKIKSLKLNFGLPKKMRPRL